MTFGNFEELFKRALKKHTTPLLKNLNPFPNLLNPLQKYFNPPDKKREFFVCGGLDTFGGI